MRYWWVTTQEEIPNGLCFSSYLTTGTAYDLILKHKERKILNTIELSEAEAMALKEQIESGELMPTETENG